MDFPKFEDDYEGGLPSSDFSAPRNEEDCEDEGKYEVDKSGWVGAELSLPDLLEMGL